MNELLDETDRSPPRSPARTVLIVDEQPLRRAAYLSVFGEWARERDLVLQPESPGTYKVSMEETALLILSGGYTSIATLRLRANLKDVDMQITPLVVISDRDEMQQVTEAIALGARGYLPTTLSLELTLKTLTFILRGGDFFPPSALVPATDGGNRHARRNNSD